jgi:hypothetical protein
MRPRLLVILLLVLAAGCAKPPAQTKYAWMLYSLPSATVGSFIGQSVALFPAAKIEWDPNQEVYRETIAGLLFATLSADKNGPQFIPVDMVQGRINAAGAWDDFLQMYKDYETTSVLRKDLLAKIGRATGARYAIVPKLLRYQQEVFDRATIVGISFLKTRQSTVDIHVQIWDMATGMVIWQGAGEGTEATEFVSGSPISFLTVAQRACESLALKMPWTVAPPTPAPPRKDLQQAPSWNPRLEE